ncbi:hypothetical protein [Aromatoleum evansii]|uniref:hypothetical protein n=1 Tax=Aromatoleum evansii TaxID=59406 RepID=UPI00145F3794|nr:hypothetical protein [Aromatoleum evansii]NMG31132.1 hypothetical protein [Aromatoleum evansii]
MKIRNLIAALSWCLAAAASAAEFQPLDRVAAARIVDPASHTVPTIVALWSSECVHCKKNLKLFSEMARGDRRFRLVTVAVEPQFAGLAELLDLLSVPGQRFAYGVDSPEALGYALDPKWRGELPRTIFFDGKGGKSALSGVVTEAKVRSALGL